MGIGEAESDSIANIKIIIIKENLRFDHHNYRVAMVEEIERDRLHGPAHRLAQQGRRNRGRRRSQATPRFCQIS